ncbi:Uncharacterised protein [Rhodococcus gordoniae]|uniref:Transmembrane protein n=1 Tax=Rhodococcus gordoniae TaxID=223392 RepID=A0A379M2S0_9NOCA|nr:hypothetical protein [Rhodococcus gordoniae]SUE16619.1 Uncharacterised protein [Rhodococcus gordoniae]
MPKLFAADLRQALDFKLSEILRFDFLLAGIGGVAVGVLAWHRPELVIANSPWLAGAVGVIIGAVVAGISVQVAFLDQPFLRKLRAIQVNPVKYIAPFLFTAVLGVVAVLVLIAMSSFTPTAPRVVFSVVSLVGGFLGLWTVLSLVAGLDTLVQFVHLKVDALDVPDDIGSAPNITSVKQRGSL